MCTIFISELMEEIEKRRESEIKARLEREKILKSLKGVDPSKLAILEGEKNRELSLLGKERKSLVEREESLKKEIDQRTSSIRSQEESLKQKSNKDE